MYIVNLRFPEHFNWYRKKLTPMGNNNELYYTTQFSHLNVVLNCSEKHFFSCPFEYATLPDMFQSIVEWNDYWKTLNVSNNTTKQSTYLILCSNSSGCAMELVRVQLPNIHILLPTLSESDILILQYVGYVCLDFLSSKPLNLLNWMTNFKLTFHSA